MIERPRALWAGLIILFLMGCNLASPTSIAEITPPPVPDSPTPVVATILPTQTIVPTPTVTLTPTLEPTPYGCLPPTDDYSIVQVYEHQINMRTYRMLEHAQSLYGMTHNLIIAITQGSYHEGVSASFGTHDGGGVVDISVRDLLDWHTILYDEFDAMILALRQAGFAAWVREENELYVGSSVHIHAVAIGDAELSPAAEDQLTGPAGYFRGYNGLPEDPPLADGWGEPILCPWMTALGYEDLR